jgi:hypothetical protein
MSLGAPRRSALALALGLLGCLALSRPAAAQNVGTAGTIGTTPTTGSLADGDIFIGIQQTEGTNLGMFDLPRFFNKANCDCDTPVFLFFTLTSTGFAKRTVVPNGNVYFYIGANCNDPLLQKTSCQFLQSEQITQFMQLGRTTINATARMISTNSALASTTADGGVTGLVNGTVPNPDCTSPSNGFNQTIWAVFDYGADGTIDYSATQAVFVDLQPPPAPTNIAVQPANEAINISWTDIDYSVNMDLQGYQVFCQREAGEQVFANKTFSSFVNTCSKTAGTGVSGLDPMFACSPLLNRNVSSFRIKILQNDIQYGATVVAIDNSGNALAQPLVGQNFTAPQKTNSFFDMYRDGNITNAGGPGQTATPGAATGGFCAVAGRASGDEGRRGWTAGLGAGAAGFLVACAAIARARRRRR